MADSDDDLPEPRNVALRSDDVAEPPDRPEWEKGVLGTWKKREIGTVYAVEDRYDDAVIEAGPNSYIALDDAE